MGLDRTDVTEGDLWRVMHPRDRDAAMAALAPCEAAATGPAAQSRTVTITCRFRFKSSWRWFEVVATDMSDDAGARPDGAGARGERALQNTRELRERGLLPHALRAQPGGRGHHRAQPAPVHMGRSGQLLGLKPGERPKREGLTQLHPTDRDALEEALDLIEARWGRRERAVPAQAGRR